jgi:sec-independent protein translocase protein TatA|tara:strand:- start:217 stop:528 length:312 start_codon:yes stop_codon:yes gene_type:complete
LVFPLRIIFSDILDNLHKLAKGDFMLQFNISFAAMPGGWEIVIIALLILLMFGAKKLPELARGLGQGIREFKGAVDGVKNEIEEADKSFDEEKNQTSDTETKN